MTLDGDHGTSPRPGVLDPDDDTYTRRCAICGDVEERCHCIPAPPAYLDSEPRVDTDFDDYWQEQQ